MAYSTRPSRTRFIVIGVAVAALCAGGYFLFGHHGGGASQQQMGGAAPVDVQTLQMQNVRTWSEFSGRLRAVDYAEIRPEVSGKIVAIRFKDGQNVKAGDVLMVIDPRTYEAALAKAQADLATAQSNAKFAKTELGRAAQMIKTQAIAQRMVDERATANKTAQAAVESAQAALKQARLNVEYAYVRAPISGRVSRAEITVGNLVQAGAGAPVLTSIVSRNGIYADFEVDEQTYLDSIRAHAQGRAQEQKIPVELVLPGDKEHAYKGMIESFDNHIDAGSGTIRARARFANEDNALLPGMFVTVRLASAAPTDALLVPERAIGTDQSKKFVYVVGEGNKAAYHEVQLGKAVGAERIVLSGLQPGDKVIVSGVQHVRPDAPVTPKEIAADAAEAP